MNLTEINPVEKGRGAHIELFLIRHAEREEIRGYMDFTTAGLTANGMKSAIDFGRLLRRTFPGYELSKPITSHINRAIDTGKGILQGFYPGSKPEVIVNVDFFRQVPENSPIWDCIKDLGRHDCNIVLAPLSKSTVGADVINTLSQPLIDSITEARKEAISIPSGSGRIIVGVAHDLNLAALLHTLAPGYVDESGVRVKYLDGLRASIHVYEGKEQVFLHWTGQRINGEISAIRME